MRSLFERDTDVNSSFINELDPIPFVVGAAVAIGFVAYTAYDVTAVGNAINWAFGTLGQGLAWLYLGGMLVLVGLGAYLMVSDYGAIKLGSGAPEYGYFSYVAMFFSAGLSAGIVFFGPAEALGYYQSLPPLFEGTATAETTSAVVPAIAYTIFHYGISAWGGYLAIGLPVAYFAYRHDAPFRVSTALYPVLGADGLDGALARIVDTAAVIATIGGVATGLGFIATQLLAGITFETGRAFGNAETVLAITGITTFFTLSLIAGVSKGIRRVSQFNIGLMTLLWIVALIGGPTLLLLNTGVSALGTYGSNFLDMSLFTGASGGASWSVAWTVFYWSWWIAWAPFVGLFLARISRGRTIRTVVGTAFLTMTATSALWFTVIGGSSVWLQHTGTVDLLGATSEFGNGVAGFALYGSFAGGTIWQLLFFVLVTTFFVTSADSSTLALGMLTTGGKRSPSNLNRAFWGVLQGLIASVLVVVGGASALRSSVIVTGAPFAIICLVAMIGFVRWLRIKHDSVAADRPAATREDRTPTDETLLDDAVSSDGD
jgi:glycine betaine transporter